MGRIRSGEDGRRVMTLFYTYDERVEDGLYASISLNSIRERLESPELLLYTASVLARR